ncbi:Wadjet anti-phage system protein JetD domain-containing protein [Paenibacillus sp. FSL L8-0638]|uniref:Wadjet anti-phage system protein JetD domain-containing protein n=1 Tax=Paenibacillus TaxID=44249 RepID=UPI003157FBAF
MGPEEISKLLREHIQQYKKVTIHLEQLEVWLRGQSVDYLSFADAVLRLEQQQILNMVKSHGRNGKNPALAYQYKIRRQWMKQEHLKIIQPRTAQFHRSMNLDWYYGVSEAEWSRDLPYLEMIDQFLKQFGLPQSEAPAPERSFQLTGDEKWITEGGGRRLLERLGLWDKLMVIPVSDPLMLAVNPSRSFGLHAQVFPGSSPHRSCQSHLIVENKTTFQGLLTGLNELPFATLIYGCGRKIVGNLEMFHLQYPLPDVEHTFYYFGDIDWEGIRIWHNLQTRHPVKLAVPFYIACLEQKGVPGKLNQARSEAALAAFRNHLPEQTSVNLENMLREGYYIPQEVLNREQLLAIGRADVWNVL